MGFFFDFFLKPGPPRNRPDRRQNRDPNYAGPERRKGPDRRGLRIGLKFSTTATIGPIEDWLEDHFPGEYRLTIEGMSDDFATKEVRVVLRTVEQRDFLRSFLTAHLRRSA